MWVLYRRFFRLFGIELGADGVCGSWTTEWRFEKTVVFCGGRWVEGLVMFLWGWGFVGESGLREVCTILSIVYSTVHRKGSTE